MKKSVLFICSYFVVAGVIAQNNLVAPIVASSKISKVTVYSDRASVTRKAVVQLQKGSTIIEFRELPGWLDERSVRIELIATNVGEIVDVRASRQYLAKTTDEEFNKAEAELQEITDTTKEIEDEMNILNAQRKQVESIRAFSLEKLPKDVAVREINVDGYEGVVEFISKKLRETAKESRRLSKKKRDLYPELQVRQKRLVELKQLASLEESTVRVEIESSSTKTAEIKLTYMLPGATWEPAHELRARGTNPKAVKFISFAVVTQTSGEDWDGAEITFSTQSPTKTINIPELDALLLGNSRSVMQSFGGQNESFKRAQGAYARQNEMWFARNNPKANINLYNAGNDSQVLIQAKTSSIFRTLQKRGTTAHFIGKGKPIIRSDGRSVRVQIGETEFAATSKLVAAPQASLNVTKTVELINSSEQPLLPGKIHLYHNGAYLGVTEQDFMAEGESFAVFLGVADQVKLSRVLNPKKSSIDRGRRTKINVLFEISLENLSDKPITVSLADRVPVSENKDIKVDKLKIDPASTPDSKGIIKWKVSLKAKEERNFAIGYRIEYSPEVVRAMRKSKASSSFHPAEQLDLSVDIGNLESLF